MISKFVFCTVLNDCAKAGSTVVHMSAREVDDLLIACSTREAADSILNALNHCLEQLKFVALQAQLPFYLLLSAHIFLDLKLCFIDQ